MRAVVFALAASVAIGGAAAAQSQPQEVRGYLVDAVCAKNHAHKPGYGASHEKSCSLMPGCTKSGFAIITADLKALTLDPTGAEQALALIKATDREKDWKVVVTGTVEGQTLTVRSIALE